MYVYIGEADTSWSYPNVTISDITCGHSGSVDQFKTGWELSFVTTTATVGSTITNTFVAYNSYVAD
jgi:hypothetical protein